MKKRDDLLLWIDIETTGLDPQNDLILEVAAQLTDRNLEPVDRGYSWAVYRSSQMLDARLTDYTRRMHTESGLLADVQNREKARDFWEIAAYLVSYVGCHAVPCTTRAAGSSVHFDVGFLRYQMPEVYSLPHYRMLNVSSIAEWVLWHSGFEYRKKKAHRALSDLRESLAEMRALADLIAAPFEKTLDTLAHERYVSSCKMA